MIKQFVTILIVCFSSIECFSQNNQSTFLFPEFTEAIVHYKDGRAFQVPINYNLLESNFIFIDKDKKKKEFSDPELVISVKVGDRAFLPITGDEMAEVLQIDPKILVQYNGYARKTKNLPYGGKTETASVGVISNLHSGTGSSSLDTENITVTNINYRFYIEKNKRLKRFTTEKQFLKLFPKQKEELKKYINESKVDFNSIEQVVQLCNHAFTIEK